MTGRDATPADRHTRGEPDPRAELVEVVDDDDRVVAVTTRATVRARNLTHRGVGILVRDGDGRVYVHRRTATKDVFPSHYDMFVGGIVGVGEPYDAAAERELAEELGIGGVPLVPLFRHRYRGPDNDWHAAMYEVRWDGPVRPQESEIDWGGWLTLDELLALLRGDGTHALTPGAPGGLPDPALPFVPDGLEIFERWLASSPDARG